MSPFACDRAAMSAEQRQRHFDTLGPKLRARIQSVHDLPDGYAFEFPADPETFELVADWTRGERLCCPFFGIDLEVNPDVLSLRLTGQEGAKEFIRAELSHFFEPE